MKSFTWALGLILALLPTYQIRFEILYIPTTLLEVLVVLFLLATIIFKTNRESWEKIKSLKYVNLAVLVFISGAAISTLISPEPLRALGQLKSFFIEPVLLFYACLILFKDESDFKIPLKFLFWSATLISFFGIVQYYTHLFLPLRFWGNGEEVKRITSVFEYPNALALFLAPLFILFLTLHVKKWLGMNRMVSVIGLVMMASAIVLTYSRGAWLGVMAGVFVLILRQNKLSLKKWGSVFIITLLVLSPILFTRFKLTFHDGSSSERVSLYQIASEKITDEPILGNGLSGFRQTLSSSNYPGEILNYPHNIILNFWLETGLLGVLGFAMLIWVGLKQYSIKPSDLRFAAGLFLLVMVVHGMVDVSYFKNDLSVLFWVVMTLLFI